MPSDDPYLPFSGPADLLNKAASVFGYRELAQRLDVDRKTLTRWRAAPGKLPTSRQLALREVLRSAPRPSGSGDFTFIDLFAGIGGMRAGFANAGGRCLFSCEWNPWSRRTYLANYGVEGPFAGDITQCDASEIPDHDVLVAGFPCQPFSIAGVSKKNALGRPHGFECTTQGTLFFDIARILADKRPKAFLLENVKNLVSHDGGKTFKVIRETLARDLGYTVEAKVLDARWYVPQHRERVIIVGFREQTGFSLDHVPPPMPAPTLRTVLHPEDGTESPEQPYTFGPDAKVQSKYVLSTRLWRYLQAYAEKHRKAGNGFGFGLVDKSGVARTLSARYYKDGSEILVSRGRLRNPRRLTPRECSRLMGFPPGFKIPVSDTQAYKQFGNSVVVPLIEAVARAMKPHVLALKEYEDTGAYQRPLVAGTIPL